MLCDHSIASNTAIMPEKYLNAPVRARGNYYEDFEPGRMFDHHWGRTVNEAENTFFTAATVHYNPIYCNAELARQIGFKTAPINPYFAFCIVLGLSVEDLSESGGAFLGLEELEFLKPVYPGDTLTARSEVVSRRESKKDPSHGIVKWRTIGLNQSGDEVLRYYRTNLVSKREPAQ